MVVSKMFTDCKYKKKKKEREKRGVGVVTLTDIPYCTPCSAVPLGPTIQPYP